MDYTPVDQWMIRRAFAGCYPRALPTHATTARHHRHKTIARRTQPASAHKTHKRTRVSRTNTYSQSSVRGPSTAWPRRALLPTAYARCSAGAEYVDSGMSPPWVLRTPAQVAGRSERGATSHRVRAAATPREASRRALEELDRKRPDRAASNKRPRDSIRSGGCFLAARSDTRDANNPLRDPGAQVASLTTSFLTVSHPEHEVRREQADESTCLRRGRAIYHKPSSQ